MILSGTGHRLEVLGGHSEEVQDAIDRYAIIALQQHMPSKVISGMAQGWDQAIATAASELGIPFIAAVPFVGQEAVWKPWAQKRYHESLEKAVEVVIVCEGGYATHKYHERDKWMVDNSDGVLALWNGQKFGGTYKTVRMAEKVQKPVMNSWPGWVDFNATNSDIL